MCSEDLPKFPRGKIYQFRLFFFKFTLNANQVDAIAFARLVNATNLRFPPISLRSSYSVTYYLENILLHLKQNVKEYLAHETDGCGLTKLVSFFLLNTRISLPISWFSTSQVCFTILLVFTSRLASVLHFDIFICELALFPIERNECMKTHFPNIFRLQSHAALLITKKGLHAFCKFFFGGRGIGGDSLKRLHRYTR